MGALLMTVGPSQEVVFPAETQEGDLCSSLSFSVGSQELGRGITQENKGNVCDSTFYAGWDYWLIDFEDASRVGILV